MLPDPEEAIEPTVEMQERLITAILRRKGLHPAGIVTNGLNCEILLRDKFVDFATITQIQQILVGAIRRHELFILKNLQLAATPPGRLKLVLQLANPHM